MRKKEQIAAVKYFSRIVIISIVLPLILTGFLFSKAKKTEIIFTGGLGELFHPMGEDPDRQKDIAGLEKILTKLKKSYPDAIFVDTGNYVDIPDNRETIYSTPAMELLRKKGLDAANLGINEITLGERLKIFRYATGEKPPFFVSILEDAQTEKPLVNPFVDLKNGHNHIIRITGATFLDHRFSSPLLEKKIKAVNQSRAIGEITDSSTPDATVLLSDLKPSHNNRLASDSRGLDIILESRAAPGKPVRRKDNTYICHRTEEKSVGLVTFRIKDNGEIDKVKCESFPIREKGGGLFSLFKKEKDEQARPPLPRLGIMVPKEDMFEKLSVSYENYEIRRINGSEFSDRIKNPQVYFYQLFKDDQPAGKTFYVEHALGKMRPTYMFFVTLDAAARIREVDFALIPLIGGINPRLHEFLEQYIGKRWDEMEFDPRGCGGETKEFKMLFKDIQLASKIADTLLE